MSKLSIAKQLLLDEIRKQYEEGEISQEESTQLILAEIEKEVNKPDIEIEDAWIEACYICLNCDIGKENDDWPDNRRENWQSVRKSIIQEKRKRNMLQFIRVACIAACFFSFLFLIGGLSISWTTLFHLQSADEQEYHIIGDKKQIAFDNDAKAHDDELQIKECTTSDFSVLCEFLGFRPPMPTWLPEGGWMLMEYYGTFIGDSYSYGVVYEKVNEKYILGYNFTYEDKPEYIAAVYAQDGEGDYIEVKNGFEIYITTNNGKTVAIWHDNTTMADLGGPISEEDVIQMIESIQ